MGRVRFPNTHALVRAAGGDGLTVWTELDAVDGFGVSAENEWIAGAVGAIHANQAVGGSHGDGLPVGAPRHAEHVLGRPSNLDGRRLPVDGPESYDFVIAARHDVPPVGRVGDGRDFVGMPAQNDRGGLSIRAPNADSIVPRSRDNMPTVPAPRDAHRRPLVAREYAFLA